MSVDVTIYEIETNNQENVFQILDDVQLSNLTEGVTMATDMITLPANKMYKGEITYTGTYAADSEYQFSSETNVFGKPCIMHSVMQL